MSGKKYEVDKKCVVTTACMTAKGLDDNCSELTVLREFRDNYLRLNKDGWEDVLVYYSIAPLIVRAIDCRTDKAEIYEKIYFEGIMKEN